VLTSSQAATSVYGKSEKFVDVSAEPVCLVERVHGTDDIEHLPTWKRNINRFTPLFSLVAVAAYWVYFAFRIKFTLAAQHAAHRMYGMAWAFIAVEMGVARKSTLLLAQASL
jgi:hypothetical protein